MKSVPGRSGIRQRLWRAGLCALLTVSAAAPMAAHARTFPEPPYLDDRSTAVAVVESLYNAINRHELTRAYSYWGQDSDVGSFDKFVDGYKGTIRTHLYTGTVTSEGAAGSVYYSVPVAVRTVNKDGTTVVFAGCYTLRLADPKIQAVPPFRPMHIVSGKLLRAKGRTSQAVPNSCPN
ncbi:MAG TPA: hypothetical protein VFJ18_02295 [Pararhizobium sp.]|nr:hypothetical protein [Pararhizobium sp.]